MEAMSEKKTKEKMPVRKKIIIGLLLVGFAAIEFPGILFVGGMVRPFIFHLPFLYGYLICGWAYMTSVLFYAWRTGWGRHRFTLRAKASD